MKIQINTANGIEADEEFTKEVELEMANEFSRFSSHISRLEVHLADENAKKGGPSDKRCMLEARIERRQPVAVTHCASTLELAMSGASEKLKGMLTSIFDRMQHYP
jgi:hypothetical protein